jgi:hypothetical protein
MSGVEKKLLGQLEIYWRRSEMLLNETAQKFDSSLKTTIGGIVRKEVQSQFRVRDR